MEAKEFIKEYEAEIIKNVDQIDQYEGDIESIKIFNYTNEITRQHMRGLEDKEVLNLFCEFVEREFIVSIDEIESIYDEVYGCLFFLAKEHINEIRSDNNIVEEVIR